MLRSTGNSPGSPCSQSWRRKRRLRWEGFAEKGGFFSLEWKRIERVKDDESGESMEPMEEVPRIWLGEDLQSVYYVAERALTSSFFEDFRSFARHIRASYLLSTRRANVNTLSSNLSIFISHEGHKIFNINKIASDFNSLSLLEPFTHICINYTVF